MIRTFTVGWKIFYMPGLMEGQVVESTSIRNALMLRDAIREPTNLLTTIGEWLSHQRKPWV